MPQNNQKGFTLIETLVAVGLFGVVISIAAGGFVKAFRTQSQVLALISANGNTSLSMEQIAREVRTGRSFSCPDRDSQFGFCRTLSFVNAAGDEVSYTKSIADGRGYIAKSLQNSPSEAVTADNVDVKYLLFRLQGERTGDGEPPRVSISLGVTPTGSASEISTARIQTTVSAREIDE